MTKDEKAIWIAVFAAKQESMTMGTLRARIDIIIEAVKEADYTILAMRRLADSSEDGCLHRLESFIDEEKCGRSINIAKNQSRPGFLDV